MSLAPNGLSVTPLTGIPAVQPGDDLAALIVSAISTNKRVLGDTDVIVVAQKVVSKAEGAVVRLDTVVPGKEATELGAKVHKDPRLVELILANSVRIVRSVPGVLITQTRQGFICANAGIDSSNSLGPATVILLPEDSDRSARQLREAIAARTGHALAVVISDSFNRPWRDGSINVAIGTAGFVPLDDKRGESDDSGKALRSTRVSIADEIASAAQLVMGESGGVPVAIVSGLELDASNEGSASLLRNPDRDLFR